MKSKYKAYLGRIEKVEIIKETSKMVLIKSVTYGERRELKESDWYSYHDTFEDAKNWIINHIQSKIDNYKRQIEIKEKELDKAKRLA